MGIEGTACHPRIVQEEKNNSLQALDRFFFLQDSVGNSETKERRAAMGLAWLGNSIFFGGLLLRLKVCKIGATMAVRDGEMLSAS